MIVQAGTKKKFEKDTLCEETKVIAKNYQRCRFMVAEWEFYAAGFVQGVVELTARAL